MHHGQKMPMNINQRRIRMSKENELLKLFQCWNPSTVIDLPKYLVKSFTKMIAYQPEILEQTNLSNLQIFLNTWRTNYDLGQLTTHFKKIGMDEGAPVEDKELCIMVGFSRMLVRSLANNNVALYSANWTKTRKLFNITDLLNLKWDK